MQRSMNGLSAVSHVSFLATPMRRFRRMVQGTSAGLFYSIRFLVFAIDIPDIVLQPSGLVIFDPSSSKLTHLNQKSNKTQAQSLEL